MGGNVSFFTFFSDQKIADQFAVRRMFRWYMAIYRQLIEWTILNTGVIVRERVGGKKKWSGEAIICIPVSISIAPVISLLGLRLKLSIAEDLAKMGECKRNQHTEDSDYDDTFVDNHENKIRLRCDVLHLPVIAKSRSACRAHIKRKSTKYYCKTCKKYLCLGLCWKYYHSRHNYLVDDPLCKGKIIHPNCVD